jgi:hypothetical protein
MTDDARQAISSLLAHYGHQRGLATVSVGREGRREHLIVQARNVQAARRTLPDIWAGFEVRIERFNGGPM